MLNEALLDTDVRNPDHHMFTMEVDTEKASSSEFNVEAKDPIAGLEEVSSEDEEVEGHKVAVEQTLQNLKSVLMSPEVSRTWERRVEEHANVGSLELLLDVKRDHEQVVVVYPDGLEACQLVLDLDDLLSHLLVEGDVVLPVLEKVVPHISDVLEVVKQGFEDILVVLEEGVYLLAGHEEGVALEFLEPFLEVALFLL